MRHSFLLIGSLAAAIGCVPDSDRIGEARIALTRAPADVACVRFVVTPTEGAPAMVDRAPTTGIDNTYGFDLGHLPLGEVTFTGFAYPVACASVTGATEATWVANPVATTLRAGVVAHVTLDFRRNNPVKGSANFVDNLVGLAASGTFGTYAIYGTASGTVLSGWGAVTLPAALPPGSPPIQQVSAGSSARCLLTDEDSGIGDVYCWGSGSNGQLGPSGNGSNDPTALYNILGGATEIVSGGSTHCAANTDASWYCWGNNNNSKITGTSGSGFYSVPQLQAAAQSQSIGSAHRCWVDRSGFVHCRGSNAFGQLGGGSSSEPEALSVVHAATAVALGQLHSCALTATGEVRCWGFNSNGQVGNNSFTNALTPAVVSLPEPAVALAASGNANCALLASGVVKCWGRGSFGETGNGVRADQPLPVSVVGLSEVASIHSSSDSIHSCAIKKDQTVWCWGSNSNGQLGDGTKFNRFVPVQVEQQ